MTPRAARLVAPLALGGVALVGTSYLALVDPNEPGHYPLCPTKALTGLDCPGCGGLRAVHSLATGDLLGALDHNAFVVLVVLPALVAVGVAWLVRSWREPSSGADPAPALPTTDSPAARLTPTFVWALVAVMAVFTVMRNVSGVAALAWLGSGAA